MGCRSKGVDSAQVGRDGMEKDEMDGRDRQKEVKIDLDGSPNDTQLIRCYIDT